ncbi:MAG: acetate kinase, partial [Thermodesulfobacteriota bacterium]|nr:acetate kinase [Thermodesulfobacteriota bacterium]
MKILVINTGSSSIKYQLFDMNDERVLASGIAEKIGEANSSLIHRVFPENVDHVKIAGEGGITDHREGLSQIVDLLVDPGHGLVRDKSEIAAVGHRVVHGGETFKSPTIVDETVIAAIRENVPLAPLHNPPNLTGIEVARSIFTDSPQVAVF